MVEVQEGTAGIHIYSSLSRSAHVTLNKTLRLTLLLVSISKTWPIRLLCLPVGLESTLMYRVAIRAEGLPWGDHRKDDKRASFPTRLLLSASSSAGFPSLSGYCAVAFVTVISSWPSFCALQKNFNCSVSICRIWINSLIIMLCAKSIHNLGISGKNTEWLKAQVDFVSTGERRVDNDVSGTLISIQGAKPSWYYR